MLYNHCELARRFKLLTPRTLMPTDLDPIDYKILRELVHDARISHVILSERVGLSSTACARRLQHLEKTGIIHGYSADIDPSLLGYRMQVVVNISLDHQNEYALAAFERAIRNCPDVTSCHLISGSHDYLVQVQVRDIEDYERVYNQHLSRLPGVIRLQSSFVMRSVIKRSISTSALVGE